jgi:hypothetical protein
MNRVVKILMERDDMTRDEAERLFSEVREEILKADPWEAEDIMLDMLGLEMDYIFDVIFS